MKILTLTSTQKFHLNPVPDCMRTRSLLGKRFVEYFQRITTFTLLHCFSIISGNQITLIPCLLGHIISFPFQSVGKMLVLPLVLRLGRTSINLPLVARYSMSLPIHRTGNFQMKRLKVFWDGILQTIWINTGVDRLKNKAI